MLRSRQRTTKRLRATRAAVSVALIVAIALSVVALTERATAVANQKVAQSRQLAASAESTLASDPGLSTQLALRGLQLSPTAQCDHVRRGSDDLVDRACVPAGHDRAAGPPAGAARVLGGRECHLSAGHRAVGVSPRA